MVGRKTYRAVPTHFNQARPTVWVSSKRNTFCVMIVTDDDLQCHDVSSCITPPIQSIPEATDCMEHHTFMPSPVTSTTFRLSDTTAVAPSALFIPVNALHMFGHSDVAL